MDGRTARHEPMAVIIEKLMGGAERSNRLRTKTTKGKSKYMANPIKDSTVIELAKKHCTPTEKWESRHHMMLIWDYFRQAGFAPADVAKAGKEFDAFYNNSRMAYASNQAKGLAEAGVCAPADTAKASTAEFK